jgi:carbamoyl-phosphate synthase small subunit
MTNRWPAALVLENGNVYRGEGFGARAESIGEVVFNTSITGYQEIISDPSYCGQIVVMTAPQIGNVGVNRADVEATRVACAGFAIRELSPITASWRAEDALAARSGRDARRDHAGDP